MLRLRHTVRFAGEVFFYARLNGAWWLVPVLLVIGFGLLAAGTAQVVVPYTVYTFF